MNTLYYGDNLKILRKYQADESVDLIYLDPPFNSKRAYNVIFKDQTGKDEAAQIQAFEDTWSWRGAQDSFEEIMQGKCPAALKNMIKSFRQFLGTNNLMAYLVMMAIRLVEMHRVLKNTGSIYLHCDPTASHYLKILMDQIYGVENFKNEVIWKRFNFHADAKRYGRLTDRLLFYTKTSMFTWNHQCKPYSEDYIRSHFKTNKNGRLFRLDNLNPPGGRGPVYEFCGVTRPWRFTKDKMEKLLQEGMIRYFDEMPGQAIPDLWDDVYAINPQSKELLGYPTQKPQALLERIIQASSNEGDVVMDPFCGCGTAVAAAEKLGRSWIGIDITHLAISLIKKRLRDHFPNVEFTTVGEPESVEAARELFKQSAFQFEAWAVSLLGGQPFKSKGGGDTGIDGLLYFKDYQGKYYKIIIEVKGGGYQPKDVRALESVLSREGAPMGILLALEAPTPGMLSHAASLGKWNMPDGAKEYPVLQIFTIQDYYEGKRPELPETGETLKKAKRELKETDKTRKLDM
jgi:site-specific DNA-methyltransferase (adenine-specific)